MLQLLSHKRPYDPDPNMARTKRRKPEEEFGISKEDEMVIRRLYRMLEQRSALEVAATRRVDMPPGFSSQLQNEHAPEGWHTAQASQYQTWNVGSQFATPPLPPNPLSLHYDPQTLVGTVPSSFLVPDPIVPHSYSNYYPHVDPNSLLYPSLEVPEPFEPSNMIFMNNLDSGSLSRHSSRYTEYPQSVSDGGSEENDLGRQHLQELERFTAQERDENRNTRKHIACIRCHRQRIKCNPNDENPLGPCETCISIVDQSIYRLPCLRLKVSDIVFFREGNSPDLAWTRRWNNMNMDNVTEWESPEIKFIQVSHGYCPDPLRLAVKKFIPKEKDILERKWVDGQVRKIKKVEPYAIEDMKTAAQEMKRYISANVRQCILEFINKRDKVVRDAYILAYNLAYNQSTPPHDEGGLLLNNVLRLWFAIRHTTASEYLCGPETLGMTPERKDRSYPLFGHIPIPPVMSAQLEVILTLEILRPLRKRVLDQLRKMIKANEPNYWFPIYLSSFILLHSCSLATAWQYKYSRRNGAKTRYSMPDYVQELHQGANTLLAHFHYGIKGIYPFSFKRNFPASMGELNEDQKAFIIDSAEYFEARRALSRKDKEEGNFHDEMYFVSQLLEEDWQPGPSI